MLLSELLGARVTAPGGAHLGVVVDVRFRRGPRQGRREGTLELIALIVSPHGRSSFYGYERGFVERPVVIARIIEWIHRASRIIPWECVARVEQGHVLLAVTPPHIPLNPKHEITDAA